MAILAIMETATITQIKNGLSAIIDRVRAGESIVVTDRGVPVAVIEPMTAHVDVDDRLARLERAGIIKRGTAPPPLDLLRKPGPTPHGNGNIAVDYLLEERREGR
ncbi:MAG: type II toxin-antitoxin system prevent-host-death family antitoxin [Chloroflexi bacterium]|nr:type II toxin-antitoxin system prevent-host-death family antitoxin [Chloroflexota bacterium]